MPTTTHNKLVRDNIPKIIEQTGKTCTTETLSDEQYIQMLKEKLVEEAREYLENGNVEELADVSEVMNAILEYHKIEPSKLESIRYEKHWRRGGFEKRILLKDVTE